MKNISNKNWNFKMYGNGDVYLDGKKENIYKLGFSTRNEFYLQFTEAAERQNIIKLAYQFAVLLTDKLTVNKFFNDKRALIESFIKENNEFGLICILDKFYINIDFQDPITGAFGDCYFIEQEKDIEKLLYN